MSNYTVCLSVCSMIICLFSFLPHLSSADDTVSSSLRVALFNIKEISTEKLLKVDENGKGKDDQLLAAAQIIRLIDPDILVVNELDQDYSRREQGLELNARRFLSAYIDTGKVRPTFPYIFTAASNTGIPSGVDLNNDGIVSMLNEIGSRNYGADCYGFGTYPGQYAMALYSKFPYQTDKIKTFQKFLWKDLPGHHIPTDYYSEEAIQVLRLSSKSHWDIPVLVNNKAVHLLLSHPTPTVFDGEEDRNGRRNFDEIKFWVHYLSGDSDLYDDKGQLAGFEAGASFIIAGDLNTSPHSDTFYDGKTAIDQLLLNPAMTDTRAWLTSRGGSEGQQIGAPGYLEQNTAQFSSGLKMQVDYILPSKDIEVKTGGVYWPAAAEDPVGSELAFKASDHRLVWLDIILH